MSSGEFAGLIGEACQTNQRSNGFLRMLRVFFKALPVFLKTTLTFDSFFSGRKTVSLRLKSAGEDRTGAVVRLGVEIRRGDELLAIAALRLWLSLWAA
jgi:hypothetical protein